MKVHYFSLTLKG